MASRYSVEEVLTESHDGDPIALGYYDAILGRGLRTEVFRLTERWDLLAFDTQQDSTMWWIIADMNPFTEFDPFNRSGGAVYVPEVTEGV